MPRFSARLRIQCRSMHGPLSQLSPLKDGSRRRRFHEALAWHRDLVDGTVKSQNERTAFEEAFHVRGGHSMKRITIGFRAREVLSVRTPVR